MPTGLWLGKPEGCDQFEDLGIDEDHIKMDVKEMEREGVVWFHLALVKSNCCEHGNEPSD
jgi:hypothetical protein